MGYAIVADLILITHFLYIFFVMGGLILTVAGGIAGWLWIRNFWFRTLHLAAILSVMLLSWLQIFCPLTILEVHFRSKAGHLTYEKTFIAHWLHQLIFFEAPMWVFSAGYSLFALLVATTWIFIPPELPWKKASRSC